MTAKCGEMNVTRQLAQIEALNQAIAAAARLVPESVALRIMQGRQGQGQAE